MKKTNDFQIRETTSASEGTAVPSCTVRRESQSVELQGNTLEAQFTTEQGEHLLVLTDNRPFEESLRCYLLDQELAIVDSLDFSPPYQSLVIKDATRRSDDQVELHGNDGQRFLIAVQNAPIGFLRRSLLKLRGARISKHGRIVFSNCS